MLHNSATFIGLTSVPTSPGYGFVHEGFPPGNSSRNGRRFQGNRRVLSENSFVMTGSRLVTRKDNPADRRVNMLFPCMASDQNSVNHRSGPRCAFTSNQKNNLRMKGIKISDVYSLNRSERSKVQARPHPPDTEKTSLSDLDLPRIINTSGVKDKITDKEPTTIWRPHNSRKVLTGSPMYARLIKGFQNDLGHSREVRSGDTSNRRLGNVLTLQHIHEILAEEKPIVPRTFYME